MPLIKPMPETITALMLLITASAWAGPPAIAPSSSTPSVDVLPPPRTPEELEARNQKVLAVLKNPAAPGALVVETGPDSPGRAAGIWPGDIITRYDGTGILTDKALRIAIANTVALQEGRLSTVDVRLPLQVRRGDQTIDLRVPKGPLGLTILTVEAGTPGPLNPPPSPREKLILAWPSAPRQTSTTPHSQWTALTLHNEPFAIERSTLTAGEEACTLNITTAENGGGEARDHIVFSTSDNQKIPGFALDIFSFHDVGDTFAQRRGLYIHGTIQRATDESVVAQPTTLDAVPTYAIATVAAALPQEAGLVMPLAQISEIDLQTRVGYCLATQGKMDLKHGDKTTAAWCVQVLHFARPEMTFWFNDARELIHADLGMGLVADPATTEQIAKFKADH